MTGSAAPENPAVKYAPPVPKAVRDAAARAEAAQTAFVNGGAVGSDGGAPPAPAAAPPAPTPQATPQTPPAPAPAPAATPPGEDNWEQRARSALGRLEQVTTQLTQANGRIDQLEGLIATMQASGQGQQPKPESQPPQVYVSQEERDEYGDPMLTVVGKRAREELSPEIAELKGTISQLQARLDGVGTVIQRQQTKTVYDTLADAIPNWQQINRSPEFAAWAAEPEPYSGQIRSKLIREAFSRHEGDRVVRFFQGFLSEAAALDPANAQPGPGTAPAPHAAGNGKVPLETFAAPGRARSAPPELPPEKPTYSRADITKFWSDKRRGLYKGREVEAEQIERDIFMAQSEGRILPG